MKYKIKHSVPLAKEGFHTNIDISNYPTGFYTVALVVNGQIVDAKTLIKQ
jgi:hypothetical protein